MGLDFRVDEFPNFFASYKEYNIKLPKNVSNSQLGSCLIQRELLMQNFTELTNIFFGKVIGLGATMAATAVDVSKNGNETEHTSVDPARRNAAFSAIFSM